MHAERIIPCLDVDQRKSSQRNQFCKFREMQETL